MSKLMSSTASDFYTDLVNLGTDRYKYGHIASIGGLHERNGGTVILGICDRTVPMEEHRTKII